MKQKLFCFIFSCIALHQYSTAQLLVLTANQTTVQEEATNKVYYRTITVNGIPATLATLPLTIAAHDLSATSPADFDFLAGNAPGVKNVTAAQNVVTLAMNIKADAFTESNEQFEIVYSYDSLGVAKVIHDTITIQDVSFQTKPSSDTAKWAVKIVTGSNFDFFDAPVFKNFAGDINIFLPDLLEPIGKNFRLGLNMGIFNYRYYDADTSGNTIVTENYLIDPTVTKVVVDATKYVRDIYYLNSKTTYNNWGLYFNPMIQLSSESKKYDLYLELHAEVIWRTLIQTYIQQSIRKDTFTITSLDITTKGVFQNFKGIRSLYTKTTYFDNYFGIGFPLKVNIKKAFDLFVSPSAGISSFKQTIAQDSDNSFNVRSRTYVDNVNWAPYGLCKFQLTTTLAPIDIAFGGEIRKVAKQKAFIGMYLGAAISLDKLKK